MEVEITGNERNAGAGERGVAAGERGVAAGERGVAAGERGVAAGERGVVTGERRAEISVSGIKIRDSKVLESREAPDGMTIRRRRETPEGVRFTTYERIEMPELMVRKRSGSREAFDWDKVVAAVRRSVGKFLEAELGVEEVVNRAVSAVYALGREEVSSQEVGEAILQVLAEMNEVAYVRFASVFREFKTLDEFEGIIKEQRGGRNGLVLEN